MKKLLLLICSLTIFFSFNFSVSADEDVITSSVYRQSMYYRNNSNNSGADTNETTGGNSIVVPGAGSYSANIPVFFVFGFNDYKFESGESYQVKVTIPYVSSDKNYDYTWNYNSICQLEELGTGVTMAVACSIEDDKKTLVFSFKSIYNTNSSQWLFRYGNWTNDSDVIINNMAATTHSESVNPSYRLVYNEKIDLSILENQNNQTNENLEDINNSITDETPPDTSEYGEVAGWLPSGTIDTLVNLPLSLLTSINNNANKICSPYVMPFFNNTSITFPCIGTYLENLSGWGNLISILDLCIACLLLYKLLMSLYKDIQKLLSLQVSDSDLGGVD